MIVLLLPGNTTRYNLTKEERIAMKRLAEDRSSVIKSADKGFCVVVWDRADYLIEAKKESFVTQIPIKRLNLMITNL